MYTISKDISETTFTSNKAVGSDSGGCDFGLVGCINHLIKGFTMTITNDGFGPLVVSKHDGSKITVGSGHYSDSTRVACDVTWRFAHSERFTSILLYSSNNRLAGIQISTNKQKNLEAFIPGYKPTDPIEIKVGSGKCAGVFGFSGTIIDSLGFAMIQ